MALQPDAVVLSFMPNDIEPKMWVFEKRLSWFANAAQRSYAACLLFVAHRGILEAAGREVRLIQEDAYTADNPRWQKIDRALAEISQLCKDKGIPFLLFVRDSLETEPYTLHREVARREGFSIAPLQTLQDPRWRHLDPRTLENSASDKHLNRRGAAISGTKIYEVMADHGIFAN